MKHWSDSPSNHMLIERGIFAFAVFRRDVNLRTQGFESPMERCVLVDRDKLPVEWPIGKDGKPLTMIGVTLDIDRYIGQRVRIARASNTQGCGKSGILSWTEYNYEEHGQPYGFSIDTEPNMYFGMGDVLSVSRFKDDEGTLIRIQLSI